VACIGHCPECPSRIHWPATFEGVQIWDLVGRLGGQMRVSGKAIIGWDLGAALMLARALGINALIVAELLPEIEAVMVRKINKRIGGQYDD
jgi:hypothetical protein